MKNKNTISAFTLIELLVVIVIIGILATIGIGTFNGYKEKAENAKALMASSNAKKKILAAITEAETALTAHYTFEDDDVADPIIDRSGSGNNAPSAGTNSYSASDDTVGGGKSIRLGLRSGARLNTVNNSPGPAEKITISTLFKINDFHTPNAYTQILGSNRTALLVDLNNNLPHPQLSFRNGSGPILNGVTEIQKEKWYHALVSFDESEDTIRLYLNGKLEAENTNYLGEMYANFVELWVGYYAADSFDGWLDEAIIAPVAIDLD